MTKAPKRHDEDDDEQFDSNKQRAADKAKIQEENADQKRASAFISEEEAANQEIANFKGLPQAGETREQLLARIRKMRDEPSKDVKEVETFRSEGMQKEFDAEQEAGKAAVAKAAAESKRYEASPTEDGGKK
jgi:hypothetical protein